MLTEKSVPQYKKNDSYDAQCVARVAINEQMLIIIILRNVSTGYLSFGSVSVRPEKSENFNDVFTLAVLLVVPWGEISTYISIPKVFSVLRLFNTI